MLLATLGVLPHKSPIYDFIQENFLPASVLILIATSNPASIKKLGFFPFLSMIVATITVIAGALIAWIIFSPMLSENAWKGFTALSASWIGGSTNMLAAGKSIQTPSNLFGIMIIVDTIIGYGWMAFLIFLSPFSKKIDQMNHIKQNLYIQEINDDSRKSIENSTINLETIAFLGILIIPLPVTLLYLGKVTPFQGDIVSSFGWTMIYSTITGILLSFTKPIKNYSKLFNSTGNYLLYLVLGAIGSASDFSSILKSPIYLLAGLTWIIIHGFLLFFISGRILKIPFSLIAISSQCNIGGIISGPILASVYHPSLVPSALILAVLGNLYGLYTAFLIGWIIS